MLIGCERLGEGEWKVAAKMEEVIYNSMRAGAAISDVHVGLDGLVAHRDQHSQDGHLAVDGVMQVWAHPQHSRPHLTCASPLLGSSVHSKMEGRRARVFPPGTPKQRDTGGCTPAQRCRDVNKKS